MGIDDAVALIVKNVGEGKEFEKSAFPCASLADDIDMTRAITPSKSELVVDATEICEAESGDVFVIFWVASDEGEIGGWFGGFGGGPNDVWCFY